MLRKHTYMSVEEKQEFQALVRKYRLEELAAHFRREPKPEPQAKTTKQTRRNTRS